MARKNPIERRVDILHDQWTEFADNAAARLLVWQVKADEAPLVETFYEKETDEHATETPDMFLRLQASFGGASAHGYALRQELIDQYEAAKPALLKDGLDASWQCPYAKPQDSGLQAFVRALVSFHAHHGENIALLATWLDPDEVSDAKSYLLWLQHLVHEAAAELRFFVVDAMALPAYTPLLEAEPVLVTGQACDLDMPAALEELAQQAGTDTPGGKFRQLLVKLGAAASAGDLTIAVPMAAAATAIATAQGWPHFAALVQMSLAGGYSALGRHLEAVHCYGEAERLGAESEKIPESESNEGGAPYGTRIRLQARFGQGAGLIAHGAWPTAAQVYLQAHALAEALSDLRAQLDCFRLASVCYEQSGELQKAWDAGMRGFGIGADMDEQTRKTSTLPYLCEQLERMTSRSEYAAHRAPLVQRAEQLLGPDFRPSKKSVA